MDPFTTVAAVFSMVGVANGLVQTALKVRDMYIEGGTTCSFDVVSTTECATETKQVSYNLINEVDEYYKTGSADIREKALVETLCSSYDFLKANKPGFQLVIEIMFIRAREEYGKLVYDKTLGVANEVIDIKMGLEDAAEVVQRVVKGINSLLAKETRISHDKPRSYLVSINYRYGNRAIKTESNVLAIIALVGECIANIIDHDFDGRMIKVGFKAKANVDYYRRINFLACAEWTQPRHDSAIITSYIIDLIKNYNKFDETLERVKQITREDGSRNVILLGRSGSGKSRTGNILLKALSEGEPKDTFLESSNGACTNYVECIDCNYGDNRKIQIWDTPGLMDEHGRDPIFLQRIKDSMLEIGQISAIVLCMKDLERGDERYERMIDDYADIIGSAMAHRVVILINRQTDLVTDDQKDDLRETLMGRGVKISDKSIYDLNASDQFKQERIDAAGKQSSEFVQKLLGMCNRKTVRIGVIDRIYNSLLKMQGISDIATREMMLTKLAMKSSEALREEILKDRKDEPKITRILSHKVVLTRTNDYSYKYGSRCVSKWSLKTVKISGILHRLKADFVAMCKGITMKNDMETAIKYLESKKLVFLKRDEDMHESKRIEGVMVLTRRYALLKVDEGLDETTLQYLKRVVGESSSGLDVFD